MLLLYGYFAYKDRLRQHPWRLANVNLIKYGEYKMAQVIKLAAELRERAGKGTAHAIRRQDKIPAVIYGDKQTPVMIAIETKTIARYVNSPNFFTHLFDLEVNGKPHRVLPRDAQFCPISDKPLHVDFLRVSSNTKVRVSIPVVFTNPEKSPGIKRGGTLNIVHHEIEVACSPDKIPEKFEISLEGLQINEAVHLGAIAFPEGVAPTTHERDFTIATIAVPSAVRSEADEAAAAATEAAGAAAAPAAGAKAGAAPAAKAGAAPAAAAKPAAGGKK